MEARALAGMLARLSRSGDLTVSPEKANYLKDYLECRTAAKGGRVLRCADCSTHAVVYNACNRRGCPVCSRKNQLNWQSKARERLLPTPHHHLVFSFPDEYTQKWLHNPRATVHELIAGARAVIRRLERESRLTLGSMLVFQSHCQGLAYKAHVHCALTDGGLDEQDQWQALGTLPLAAMTLWLKKALKADPQSKGWRIHQSRHETDGRALVQYLGRRLHGAVVSPEELSQNEATVAIEARNGSIELPISTFFVRYLNHIPQKGTVLVRNCGLYSNRHRHRHARAWQQLDTKERPVPDPWQERCPRCRGILHTIANSLARPLAFDHERLGFGTDPPMHWELSKAS